MSELKKYSASLKKPRCVLTSGNARHDKRKSLHQYPQTGTTATCANRANEIIENFITKPELARHLDVSISLINRLMAEDGLPCIHVGRAVRFKLSKVLEWLHRKEKS